MRAQILLKVDQGEEGPSWTDEQVADALEVNTSTVYATRRELVTEGFDGALNRKKQVRPSRVPLFDEAKERTLIATAEVTGELLANPNPRFTLGEGGPNLYVPWRVFQDPKA